MLHVIPPNYPRHPYAPGPVGRAIPGQDRRVVQASFLALLSHAVRTGLWSRPFEASLASRETMYCRPCPMPYPGLGESGTNTSETLKAGECGLISDLPETIVNIGLLSAYNSEFVTPFT